MISENIHLSTIIHLVWKWSHTFGSLNSLLVSPLCRPHVGHVNRFTECLHIEHLLIQMIGWLQVTLLFSGRLQVHVCLRLTSKQISLASPKWFFVLTYRAFILWKQCSHFVKNLSSFLTYLKPSPSNLSHLPGKASPQLPLQPFIDHELDGRVQDQEQGWEGPVPQCSCPLVSQDLPKCICET